MGNQQAGPGRVRFEVVDDGAAAQVIQGLVGLGAVVVVEEAPATPVCPLCDHETPELQFSVLVQEPVCIVCWRTAQRLAEEFDAAMTRTKQEFRGQVRQMVLDVRGGADEPVFYRGFE